MLCPDLPQYPDADVHTRADRGAIIWLTGLPGSGKSTLAALLRTQIATRGVGVVPIDGDVLRRGLCHDLGFDKADRSENARRAAEVAVLAAHAGFVCTVALISPYASDRLRARAIAAREGVPFLEVYVDAPRAVCAQRDPKGLYAAAHAGTLTTLTGVSDPYEPPLEPDVHVKTAVDSPDTCAALILAAALPLLGRRE